jgi:CheY-like chemotaxis protein
MPTVLIIDDYELNIKLVEDLLLFSGYTPLVAYTAEAGLALAREQRPDLILMDMRLTGPGMDGWEATQTIKQDRELSHIPVVALTAEVWDSERERAFEVGCDGFIAKPFTLNDIQQCFDYYLQS